MASWRPLIFGLRVSQLRLGEEDSNLRIQIQSLLSYP
jgi:hypothetical protein